MLGQAEASLEQGPDWGWRAFEKAGHLLCRSKGRCRVQEANVEKLRGSFWAARQHAHGQASLALKGLDENLDWPNSPRTQEPGKVTFTC